jgi:hypothetical protein
VDNVSSHKFHLLVLAVFWVRNVCAAFLAFVAVNFSSAALAFALDYAAAAFWAEKIVS